MCMSITRDIESELRCEAIFLIGPWSGELALRLSSVQSVQNAFGDMFEADGSVIIDDRNFLIGEIGFEKSL